MIWSANLYFVRDLSRKEKLAPERPIFEANILRLSHDGRGIADIKGKKTFIFGALPHEQVTFQYTSIRKRLDEGRTVTAVQAAEHRIEAQCPHFGVCGGCQLQHLAPHAQLAHKQSVMLEQLKHLAGTQPNEVLPPLTGPHWGYRRKARMGVRFVYKKGQLLLGFREQQSNRLADLKQCDILYPPVSALLPTLRAQLADLSCYESIAQIEISVGTGSDEIGLIVRHLAPLPESDTQKLCDFAKTHKLNLFLQPGGLQSIHCVWPNPEKKYLHYTLSDYGLKFDFHPASFTQVNHEMNAKMVKQALLLLNPEPTECVLDLFCGIGNFSLPLAQKAAKVVGVEASEQAVENAQHNARLNGIQNADFYVQDLAEQPHSRWAQQDFDSVLLDPPRTGALALMPWLAKKKPKKILYISCQPATMARDAALLIEKGYQLSKAGIMDMFPHTSHVESIALFTSKKR